MPAFRLSVWGPGLDPIRGGQLAEVFEGEERVARLRVTRAGARMYRPDAARLGRVRPSAEGVVLVDRSAETRCAGHVDPLGVRLDCGDDGVLLGAWRDDGSFDARVDETWLGTREPTSAELLEEGSGDTPPVLERWRMPEGELACTEQGAVFEATESLGQRRFAFRPGTPLGVGCAMAFGLVTVPDADDEQRGMLAWALWASALRHAEQEAEGSGDAESAAGAEGGSGQGL